MGLAPDPDASSTQDIGQPMARHGREHAGIYGVSGARSATNVLDENTLLAPAGRLACIPPPLVGR